MKKIKAYALTLGLICTSFAVQAKEDKQPEWVNNPTSNCKEEEFCSVGIGSSEKKADADASSGIAKIFEAKVKASFSSTTESKDDEVSSAVTSSVSENVAATVSNMEIKERFKKGATFYSFAVLNKERSAEMVREKIGDIDERMEMLLTDDTAMSAAKLEKLYEQRLGLNQQHIVLTGRGILATVSYSDVFKNKKEKMGGKDFYLFVAGTKNKSLEKSVKSLLLKNGFTFVKNREGARVLTITVSKTQEPFAIPEMVKYEYTISIRIKNSGDGKTVELLEEAFEGTGLNEKQAFDEAVGEFEKYLKEHLEELEF